MVCNIILHVQHLKIYMWWIWYLEDNCRVFGLSVLFLSSSSLAVNIYKKRIVYPLKSFSLFPVMKQAFDNLY